MNVHHSSVEQIERQLVSLIEEKSIDLSLGGELLVERLSVPYKSDQSTDIKLTYYLHQTPQSVIDCHLYITTQDEGLNLEVELSIKKFITPTLSLSSAHIAGLIHHLKRSMSLIRHGTAEDTPLSWEFNRTQRRIRLLNPLALNRPGGAEVLQQITQVLSDIHQLSLEILREEAEYSQVMEQWRHARRAYLVWAELAHLNLEQLQTALAVLYRLKDWTSCVKLLREGSERFSDSVGAKLAHACCVLYRDVILDPVKALELSERASALDPSEPLYQQTTTQLRALNQTPVVIASAEQSNGLESSVGFTPNDSDDSDEVQELFDDLPFDEQLTPSEATSDSGSETHSEEASRAVEDEPTTPLDETSNETSNETSIVVDSTPSAKSRLGQQRSRLSGRSDKGSKKSRRPRKQKMKRNKKRGKR